MTDWDELVTVALLGTDRRPVPDDLAPPWAAALLETRAGADPASVVLALAAAHRAVTELGPVLRTCAAPDLAPPLQLPRAPTAAQDLMAGLLTRPDPVLVNAWLAGCAERGLGLAPDHWPRLAQLASRNSAYDRVLLGQVLGPRGRWFLSQHPQWSRLSAPAAEPDPAVGVGTRGASAATETPDHWQPFEVLLSGAAPPTLEEAVAALRLIAGGSLGAGTRRAAACFGQRVPLDVWAALAEWTGHQRSPADVIAVDPAPVVQLALATLQRTVQARIEIDQVFTADPTGEKKP